MFYGFKKRLLLILLFSLTVPEVASSVRYSRKSFEQILMATTTDNRRTFLSDLPFNEQGKVNLQACPACPNIQVPIRWIPIVPIALLFADAPCYREKNCVNQRGERTKGLLCCEKIMPDYEQRRFDPDNYVPEIALYAAHIKTHCKAKNLGPEHHQCGFIARRYLMMHKRYRIPLSEDALQRYHQWDRAYPASPAEIRRFVYKSIYQRSYRPDLSISKQSED